MGYPTLLYHQLSDYSFASILISGCVCTLASQIMIQGMDSWWLSCYHIATHKADPGTLMSWIIWITKLWRCRYGNPHHTYWYMSWHHPMAVGYEAHTICRKMCIIWHVLIHASNWILCFAKRMHYHETQNNAVRGNVRITFFVGPKGCRRQPEGPKGPGRLSSAAFGSVVMYSLLCCGRPLHCAVCRAGIGNWNWVDGSNFVYHDSIIQQYSAKSRNICAGMNRSFRSLKVRKDARNIVPNVDIMTLVALLSPREETY